jgi:peptide/nickel transport system permease protein
MAGKPLTYPIESETAPRVSEFKRFRRVFLSRGVVIFGLVILIIFIILAVFAPLVAPYNPNRQDLNNTLLTPNRTHLLGTDIFGRDTLSRIIFGARTSLLIGLAVVFISSATGMALGLIAGYFGGWSFTIIMRLIDALMTFPMIILALVIASLLGNGMKNVIIALTVSIVPVYARLMCAQVLSVKQNDYITASRSIGCGYYRLLIIHILPNCLQPIIILITMMLGSVILAEAGLSFLGIGIEPPTAAWGSMINEARPYLFTNPMLSLIPGVAIMFVAFSFNMVGDGLRDALDPRLRGTL